MNNVTIEFPIDVNIRNIAVNRIKGRNHLISNIENIDGNRKLSEKSNQSMKSMKLTVNDRHEKIDKIFTCHGC